MTNMLKPIAFAVAIFLAALTSGASPNQSTANLKFTAPAGWVEEKPSSNMRVGQFKLPKAADDTEDASLVVYYFGQGQGGGTAANIERWVGQMKQPEGTATKPSEETLTVNGLKVTSVDVRGTYTAETAPGSGTFNNSPNFRLKAAVIETPKGSYYVKVVGPEKTIGKWDTSIAEFVKSFEFK
ncbi:MAG: hypothetical protein DMF69_15650 [Acidobacteria bacterium]|nr:MAG: hypothetical protein DMF69_15650 [Acidobacteriota bacterium]